ncbi:two-component system, CitB family, response regulator CitT [Virgibacillus subterraneus]|uniref:Two-component system, CitB family, response regulator CitT n=1 Tax=Virgibacillus subterraneus TaxID=621109 RepID=A0A1H9BK77_9BACI|nr:response regulator [Virgibacillus subterraneus]SEP89003.1 two-component system, CitB family, response regulator CitT [Virgibacillus subterraneus]
MIRVIIAEDDYRVAGIHEEFLMKISGVKVVGKALNGKETLKLVDETSPDLVLLDIFMPDILGIELIKEMRDLKPQLDIIMISAATNKEMIEEAIRKGLFDYIIKPVKMDRFVETIEKYKDTKKTLDENEEINQSFLDEYFGQAKQRKSNIKETPKGIDPLTLEKIEQIMFEMNEGITAEEMGLKIGASRTTARRYLEHLISEGTCAAELEYGIVGRPERKYNINRKTS